MNGDKPKIVPIRAKLLAVHVDNASPWKGLRPDGESWGKTIVLVLYQLAVIGLVTWVCM